MTRWKERCAFHGLLLALMMVAVVLQDGRRLSEMREFVEIDAEADVMREVLRIETAFHDARRASTKKLEVSYGKDNYERIFLDDRGESIGRTYMKGSGDSSWKRLKRRFQIKILQTLESKPKFVWATNGHSTAASHGNLFRDSYTHVMGRTMQPVFDALGIEWEARNFAMGSQDSAPEQAWCMDEIIGPDDADVISWDYGMTDRNFIYKMKMYCYRAALHRNSPACIALLIAKVYQEEQTRFLAELEQRGASTFYTEIDTLANIKNSFPDSKGIDFEEAEKMPELVRNMRCGRAFESGDPFCGVDKFDTSFCPDRRFMVAWHPGWKWHALVGNLNAHFLFDVISDAIAEIKNIRHPTLELIDVWQREADMEREQLLSSSLPEDLKNEILAVGDDVVEIDINDIYTAPNYCHIARVPSHIRHSGILTDDAPSNMTHYTQGISRSVAMATENDSTEPRLLLDEDTRLECDQGDLLIDHHDFFFVHQKESPKQLLLPTDREIEAYGRGQELKGLVVICMADCLHGACPPGRLNATSVADSSLQLAVNSQKVTSVTTMGRCDFLKGESGHYFGVNEQGKVHLQIQVTQEESYVQIGSVVVW